MRTLKPRILLALSLGLVLRAAGDAQAPAITSWSSPDALKTWVEGRDDGNPPAAQAMSDAGGSFLRITPATQVVLEMPGLSATSDLSSLPILIDPTATNAVKVRIRHNAAFRVFGGYWLHRGTAFDGESYDRVPFFDSQSLPGDGQWHDLVFRFSDSPFVAPGGIVAISFGFLNPQFQDLFAIQAQGDQTSPTAYVDLASIDLISVAETLPQPTIGSFQPARGRHLAPVTIHGSGFAQPAARNRVFFGDSDESAEIVSGDASTLVVDAAAASGPITVLVPGGGRAVSAGAFALLGPPSELRIAGGDHQTGPVGVALQPLSVTLVDFKGSGLPGETIQFQVVSGAGTLSTVQAVTDDSGLATVTLTPTHAGLVQVAASAAGVGSVTLTAVGVP